MSIDGSDGDTPRSLSELLRNLAHLQQQQKAIQVQLWHTAGEQTRVRKRLEAVELLLETLNSKEVREEGIAAGRRKTVALFSAIFGPVAVSFFSWFLINTIHAIHHAQTESLPGKVTHPHSPHQPDGSTK